MKKLFLILFALISFRVSAFDTWWHAESTRKAMVANGFSADARLAVQVSNYLTDFMSVIDHYAKEKMEKLEFNKLNAKRDASYVYMHFDAIFSSMEIEQNWQKIFDNTVQTLKKYHNNPDVKSGFREIVLFNIIGASLHIVQDFYSHSNWVNIFTSRKIKPVPTWYEADPSSRKKLSIFTGAYPDGSAKGRKSHSELNKDYSARPLNKEAVEVAERASIEWVKKLMDATPELPWAELKNYNIQGDPILKNFLVKLDATFLTSSSIVAGHLDGDKPAKFIFNQYDKDVRKEQAKARVALSHTISEYFAYLSLENNVFRIPSPYWAGFQVYFITRDLANGLSHSYKIYTKPDKEK